MQNYLPESFIAGAVPYGTQDPVEAAYHSASVALDTEDIRLITSTEKGHVYFIAAHSKDFQYPYTNSGCSLAHCLPGMPEHKGDGTYVLQTENAYAVVVKQNEEIKSMLLSSISGIPEPVYNMTSSKPIKWQGYRLSQTEATKKTVNGILKIGVLLLTVMMSVYVLLSALTGIYTKKAETFIEAANGNIKQLMTSIQNSNTSSVENHLSEIQKIAFVVNKKGGKINEYRVENNRVLWSVKLPRWVSATDYAELGNVTTEVKDDGIVITNLER